MRVELFINGVSVAIKEDVGISLTMAIADIKNPDKRNGGFSRTIQVIGTTVVNRLFGQIFEFTEIQNTSVTNFNPDYNPNLKANAVIQVDGVEQFRGFMRMRGIKRDNQDLGKVIYDCEVFGNLGNIVTNLGTATFADLDLSEWNHTYDRNAQQATWGTIDPSMGYHYPMIQYGNNDGVNWNVNHFYPAVYEKVIFDKVMAYAGYEYDSPFITGGTFSTFVLPFTGTSFLLSQTQAQDRLFSAEISAPYTVLDASTWASIPEPFPFDNEISDPDAQYDPATYLFTTVSAGYYEFKVYGEFNFSAVGGDVLNIVNSSLVVTIKHQRGATITTLGQQYIFNQLGGSIYSGNSTASVTFTYTTNTVQCNAGDIVWVELAPRILGSNTTGGQYAQFNLDAGTFFNSVTNASIVEGATVDMNAWLPNDVKLVDYFLSVVKDFNLMVEPDKTQPNKVYIDTAEDFYSSGTQRDWSHKLDVSKSFEIQPMGALDSRRYVLQWKESSDYFSTLYRNTYAEGYGMKKHDVTNDFVKNDNVYTSIFESTPMVGRGSDDRVYPEIYTIESGGNRKRIKSGLRRLIATVERNTIYPWNYITASGTYVETVYPASGHLDDIDTPTFDLNFSNPREIYYSATNYTDGNLWNRYHKKYIEEITDRNSKVVIGYFYLKPLDFLRLSFRDEYFIHGHYYRLLRIIDYNPAKEGVTKCEFLLKKSREVFSAATYPLLSYANNTNGDVSVVPRGGGGTLDGLNIVVGEGSSVERGGGGNASFGSRNFIGAESNRNFIAGSSGVTISPNITGVTVINTDDIEITESNVTYINGNRYVLGSDQIHTVTTSQTITGAGTYYCNGLLTLTLDSNVLRVNDRIQVFNINGSTVTVAGGGLTIRYANNNSVASFSMNHIYESLTLTYTGTYYIIT
jgi:hypothetical protein